MKSLLFEFLGTFGIVFLGTGSIILNQEYNNSIGNLGISIVFGFAVFLMIFIFGRFSEAHFNPAVSIIFITGNHNRKKLLLFILAQIFGGICASIILGLFFPQNNSLGATLPQGSELQSFLIEILLAFILIYIILFLSSLQTMPLLKKALLIGLVVMLEAFFAGPVTGASMNPARSIAPALVSMNFKSLWIYISAPILGGFIAALLFKYLPYRNFQNESL